MRRELRKAAHQVEIDALLSLCHHSPISAGCDACAFRQQACIEHLQRIVSETVACLSGIHASCECVVMEQEKSNPYRSQA